MTENSIDCNYPELTYVRRLYDYILDWYKNADTKAQAILTLDGALITFITGFVLLKPDDLNDTVADLGTINYIFLALMATSLIVSVSCALNSFRSRLNKWKVEDPQSNTTKQIPIEKMWFFGDIAVANKTVFKEAIKKIDYQFEITVLADQIHILSNNVLHKHQWVTRAFWAFGFCLVFLILFIFGFILTLT
jgi:hypothetical protein